MNNSLLLMMFLSCSVLGLASCKKSNGAHAPRIVRLEIGEGDRGKVMAGADLHFEADIEAGNRLDVVEIMIRQRVNGTYAQEWSYRMVLETHRGARNAHLHEHADIPAAAAPAVYDFVVVTSDQNGTHAEARRDLTIQASE